MTKCNCFICTNRDNKDKIFGYLMGQKEELEVGIAELERHGITETSIRDYETLGGYLAACKHDLEETEMFLEQLRQPFPTLEQIAEQGGLKLSCLENAGITTTEQLLNQTPRELLRLPGFGKVSLVKLISALSKFNLKLKDE